jgi:hypothetical protein
MKKHLRSPEHWQDFESLCKKLFGEILGCPHTIKKNGRLGQPQLGVDVYGKPKGENYYWGIQCKGKDNYVNAQLTEKEIDEEIEKAKKFEPALKVFAFATTAPKDVNVERYIRLKDQQSEAGGGFEIILYSWQDLVDLIEENRDTYNWFVNNVQFKDQFDVDVSFAGGLKELKATPRFLKTITRYQYAAVGGDGNRVETFRPAWLNQPPKGLFGPKESNHSEITFDTIISNTGSRVIEDWKLQLFFPNSIEKIHDEFSTQIIHNIVSAQYRTEWADNDRKIMLYKPLKNTPLIQKDSRSFTTYLLPVFQVQNEIIIRWKLLARDYDKEGTLKLIVEPRYEETVKTKWVWDQDHVREEEELAYYITKS